MQKIIVDTSKTFQEEFDRICATPHDYAYVYLIRCNDLYKIGYSQNPESRLDGMQTSNPYLLELLWKQRIPNYQQLEEMMHERFASKRVRREWFKLGKEDVEFILSLI